MAEAKTIEIKNNTLEAIVEKLTGVKTSWEDHKSISKNINLHFFVFIDGNGEQDEIHMTTDGAGGFSVFTDPLESTQKEYKGHFQDYV